MLYVKDTEGKGVGVFALENIQEGKLILKFEGPIYTKDTCPNFSESLQVGINSWMWSSGGLDDYVNHSCDPNTGLYEFEGGIYLKTIKKIQKDEEISFDYSTSMVDEPWFMECLCESKKCRKIISNFKDIPKSFQNYYFEKNIVLNHVKKSFENINENS